MELDVVGGVIRVLRIESTRGTSLGDRLWCQLADEYPKSRVSQSFTYMGSPLGDPRNCSIEI